MSDIIQLLPDHIANQIAAGEVVQRPASVVKELLENAIDSGAQNIRLIIKNAGKTLIQVVDDGCGMSSGDAKRCFERHATSKIKKAEDLFSITTKGFRGEAMASIAAVSQVEMKTKQQGQELGIRIEIAGSKIQVEEPCQTASGTSIAVKNLFFNIPARRNFLKTNTVEMRHIIDEFQHVALAHPDIFFSLHHNNDKLHHLPSSNLRQRITGLMGNKVNKSIIPIDEQTDIITINGYIGKPDTAKKTRGSQYFFVNNRYIKSAYLNHAILNAYEDLIPDKVYPLYVIFFQIDPSKIDVNVHPTKQEIKFEDEKLVYNYLRVTVRHALAQYSITPSLNFDVENSITQHLDESEYLPKTEASDFSLEGSILNSKASQKSTNSGYQPSPKTFQEQSNLDNWTQLYQDIDQQKAASFNNSLPSNQDLFDAVEPSEEHASGIILKSKASKELPLKDPSSLGKSKQLYQLHQRYILSPIASGFLLFDQHIAHQRIMYERYLFQFENKKASSQQLLFAQNIELALADAQLLQGLIPELNSLGIDIREFGNNSFVIQGLPAEFNEQNGQAVVLQLLEQFKQNLDLRLEQYDNISRSLAYQSAIKPGQFLLQDEMRLLIDELFACQIPYAGPNGKKTFISMDLEDLGKRFEQ